MSGLDIATSLYKLLSVATVKSLLDGGIYKFNRPINSRKKDIVISIAEYNGSQFNTGFIDINIHVPNMELINDQTNPDLVSMKSLVDVVMPLLNNVEGYSLSAKIVGIPVRDSDGQWYCNIRIGFYGVDENSGKDLKLVSLSGLSDSYGGFNAVRSEYWSGKGAMVDLIKGNQLNVKAGRYEFHMKTDWILPFDSKPEKYMVIVTSEGEYSIRGIIPELGMWRVNTIRKDGKINS